MRRIGDERALRIARADRHGDPGPAKPQRQPKTKRTGSAHDAHPFAHGAGVYGSAAMGRPGRGGVRAVASSILIQHDGGGDR